MSQPNIIRENLGEKARRLRAVLGDAACGPLVAATEIRKLHEAWDEYRPEAGGDDCAAWLRKEGLGNGYDYWRKRAEAVDKIGESCRRTLHHDTAVWLAGKLDGELLKRAHLVLMRAGRAAKRPLTRAMAVRALRAAELVAPATCATCARCAELEKQLREAGIEPSE